eukprot:TRINITY_DN10743_c0_g1_i1.p1 TRINITY_DN10743_c0_g1~~TRINITY_DN10743_c0_g1_i1.p1  ORF type:complete len:104 (+),score=11.31 TRINITY_DN10743_c0_g1_i1:139-450(+)
MIEYIYFFCFLLLFIIFSPFLSCVLSITISGNQTKDAFHKHKAKVSSEFAREIIDYARKVAVALGTEEKSTKHKESRLSRLTPFWENPHRNRRGAATGPTQSG